VISSRAGDTDNDTEIADAVDAEDQRWWQDIPKFRMLLAEEIRLLRTNCAWPSRQEIADATADLDGTPVSAQSISNVLSSKVDGSSNISGWTVYRKIVEVLGGDLRYFYPLYLRASGLAGARDQLERFERIVRDGLPTLADPSAPPFEIPGHQPAAGTELIFVDQPPPLGERLYLPHDLWVLQLRANPGRWACVPAMNGGSYVTAITKGGIRSYRPAGSFEALWRMNRLYLRYVGQDREYA
jgi:hypothetical protein